LRGKERPIRRGAKPAKSRVEAKPPIVRKSRKSEGARVHDLEKRLAESLKDKAGALGKLQARDRELVEAREQLTLAHAQVSEALEQQTATSEILRVISQSPTDVQPVFDAIANSAMRLFRAWSVAVNRYDGELIQLGAARGGLPDGEQYAYYRAARRPNAASPTGRAIMERSVQHEADAQSSAYPEYREVARARGFRTIMAAPILHDGKPVGVMGVTRSEVLPFTEAEIGLLKTFADQAMIAIENVRLFKELEARNSDLTATSEILQVISRSPTDVQPVFDTIGARAKKLCNADFSLVARVDGELIHLMALHGVSRQSIEAVRRQFPMRRGADTVSARVVRDGAVVHVEDVLGLRQYEVKESAQVAGFRSALGVPMLREGQTIGAIVVLRAEPGRFADSQVELLKNFADQAVIAIENVRLFKELEARNHDLMEALEQQTATSEILRVIGQAQTDVQPVFDAIVASATPLCEADFSGLYQFDGALIHFAAHYGRTPEEIEAARQAFPQPLGRASVSARAILACAVIQIADLSEDLEVADPLRVYRTVLSVPMIRGDRPIGAITVARRVVRPFTDKQIELLQTFADQAVIAIENVRLFNETKETLEQQTATSQILRVIASSPTDLQPVLDAVAETAARLCEAKDATIRLPYGDSLQVRAHFGPIQVSPRVPISRDSVAGRAMIDCQTFHVHDLSASEHETEFPVGRATARRDGVKTFLATPLLREGAAIGVINVRRAEVRPFSEKHVALLKTFADQAVIAIENVRLFTETKEALEQQTATSEILNVISRSPTDVQPVLDTVVEHASRLCSARDAQIFRREDAVLRLVAHHGPIPTGGVGEFTMPITRGTVNGRAVMEQRPIVVADLRAESMEFPEGSAISRNLGHRAVLSVPLMREGVAIGTLSVRRAEVVAFTDAQMALLQTFADQAVIAIENVRLFTELQQKNEALTQAHAQVSESLEQQTATADILRVISASPTDVSPVFRAIVQSATRLCHATFGTVFRYDGELITVAANQDLTPEEITVTNAVYPAPATRGIAAGRAIVDRTVVHISDIRNDPDYVARAPVNVLGYRTALAVPMLREGSPIGVFVMWRREVRPFTDKQIELVKTFADQAVIAIENVRLFNELGARNAELTDSLARQTATGEVLRAISRAQTDATPVFDVIAANAMRLCGGGYAGVGLFDGALQHIVAVHNVAADLGEQLRRAYPRPADETSASGRSIVTCATVQIPDLLDDPGYALKAELHAMGFRSLLAVPLLRDGQAIGSISVGRSQVGLFPEAQVALMRTFAEQAVIAIENVRLFKELEARNSDLRAALEQQTSTSEILRVISSSPTDEQPVFDAIVQSARRLCEATFSVVFLLDTGQLTLAAVDGVDAAGITALHGAYPRSVARDTTSGRSILDRRVVHLEDSWLDPEYTHPLRDTIALRSILTVPIFREGLPIGALSVWRGEVRPFTDKQIALLQTFADQAVIALENVRLFKELEVRNRDLTAALEQQTATSEILRAITHAPTDTQPVFDTIVRSAVTLCHAAVTAVFLTDGQMVFVPANYGSSPEALGAVRARFPRPLDMESSGGIAILTRSVVHVPDTEEPSVGELVRQNGRRLGFRSLITVPMLREGAAVGAIGVYRREPGRFSDVEVALLQTFADQAVIAIENVRLFKELQARTGELTQSVEKLTALGEVSRAVSSTLDVETVLDTIVSRASQLAGAAGCSIFEYDEAAEQFELRATHNYDVEFVEALRATPLRKGEGLMGRAAEMREPVQVADITQPGAYQSSARDTLIRFGYRAVLSVPLLREDQIIGSLSFTRKAPGEFPPEVVDVLKTFATQSALAIQNARLFREIADKSAQLEAASRHKSEFLANMSHELAHAAECDHWLLRGAGRSDVRGADREAGRVPEGHLRLRPAPAVPDQRHPRSLQDRGGADGAGAGRLPPAPGHRECPGPCAGTGTAPWHHAGAIDRPTPRRDSGR
jgi:GAF domain-containing protein